MIKHPLYDVIRRDLAIDIDQMAEEGHDVAGLKSELDAAQGTGSADALLKLQAELWQRPSPKGFAYVEPDDWQTISAGFPKPQSHAAFKGSDADLADRLHAAWLGRCAGCQLGKPLEGVSRPESIKGLLQKVGSWPLADYMNAPPADLAVEQLPTCDFFQRGRQVHAPWCRGNFDHAAPDDDINYMLVSLRLLEQHGIGFTSEQALGTLLEHSPYYGLWASGRNMFRAYAYGIPIEYTAILGNPCRQSLGAMIRVDPFGWCAPANPALAASMAFRDAVNSQRRNGIYSGIFFAVLLADTLAHGDPVRAIETASAYVPARSRFAEMIRFVKQECGRTADWEQVNQAIHARWPSEAAKFNHAIPNAAIVLLGLLKGGGDFTRSLGITVSAGLDTDCTGATVGSIMGCSLGAKGIPGHWTEPFRDTMRTFIRDMHDIRISEVARRTYEVAKKNTRR
jgi:ADP-ribosylglycohydrolase